MPSKEKSSFGILAEFEFLPKVTPFHFCGLQEILQEAKKILQIDTCNAAKITLHRIVASPPPSRNSVGVIPNCFLKHEEK